MHAHAAHVHIARLAGGLGYGGHMIVCSTWNYAAMRIARMPAHDESTIQLISCHNLFHVEPAAATRFFAPLGDAIRVSGLDLLVCPVTLTPRML